MTHYDAAIGLLEKAPAQWQSDDEQLFAACTPSRDSHRLLRQLQRLKRDDHNGNLTIQAWQQWQSQAKASVDQLQARQNAVPLIEYPPDLPISEKRAIIAAAIQQHQVVVLAGETGSGKTTQIPKICLELGRGVRGMIGHTQPRRIAASTVASRIAEELGVKLGEEVGYQVRFTDHSNPSTYIKLMTDGILLAEIQQDKFLSRYDTIIIDEAHERSLNIDFLLGFLKQLLPKRPDLKVIITSATIDTERFSQHFDNAPVIEVSGRMYPVEVLYRPMLDEQDNQAQAITEAVQELIARERAGKHKAKGDMLVFLSGEREIRETAQALRKADIPQWEVLPLYARLSLAEQNKIFQQVKQQQTVQVGSVGSLLEAAEAALIEAEKGVKQNAEATEEQCPAQRWVVRKKRKKK